LRAGRASALWRIGDRDARALRHIRHTGALEERSAGRVFCGKSAARKKKVDAPPSLDYRGAPKIGFRRSSRLSILIPVSE
jgi:hypothetical protein